jgi:hypothetical protein
MCIMVESCGVCWIEVRRSSFKSVRGVVWEKWVDSSYCLTCCLWLAWLGSAGMKLGNQSWTGNLRQVVLVLELPYSSSS